MDCCDSKGKYSKKADCCDSKNESMKDEKSRTKKTFMWVIIGILLIATIFVTAKASSPGTGQTISGGAIDTSGWTENEVMNYQMHGIVPARVSGAITSGASAGSGSSSQVGSC